jgi:hypothetical protein
MRSYCSRVSNFKPKSYGEDFKLKTRGFDEYW